MYDLYIFEMLRLIFDARDSIGKRIDLVGIYIIERLELKLE